MIVLDTNVVSEPMRSKPNRMVLDWLDRQPGEALYLTTTSLAELVAGVRILPAGQRRSDLDKALSDLLERLFGPRILPFDREAALAFGAIVARGRARGQPISFADAQIAAIAETHDFAVATRDVDPFLAAGLRIIDPWTA
ncbi:type II toxin-antitoxin system VapC family toxin [Enterovirga rhinocerotis]|uniref:Ribonuclease VapC n=1 Tax=Enterovirga rhinocerotis TaxID=1339210 RepID=A0A4R7C8N4_9HYPH|nr:type II toxin-antitoxin system VapC family toxin [Enterovirga rhinocerotis]TDR94798.1 hypothetical protein EV668_2087 [Enterovirga rhinocerotis]